MNAGNLDKKVILLQPIEIANRYGSKSIEYKPYKTVWAQIKPVRGQQFYLMQRAENKEYVTITIRYRDDIDASYKVRYKNIDYGIDSVVDTYAQHESLELYCSVNIFGGKAKKPKKTEGEKNGGGIRFSPACGV